MKTERINNDVVSRFQKGSHEAFEEVYRHYKNTLYFFAYTFVSNQADAEEIVQESFIKIYRNIKSLKNLDAFHSWIFMITANTAKSICNKKSRILIVDDDMYMEEVVTGSANPVEEYENKEIVELVKNEINQLPLIYIQTATLRYLEGLSLNEISEVLDVKVGTIKNRLNRIRGSLQSGLKSKGMDPTKYLSLGLSPFVVQAFEMMESQTAMNVAASDAVYTNILASTQSKTSVLSSTMTKVLLAICLGGSGYALYANLATTEADEPVTITQIDYSNEYTSDTVPVEITLTNSVDDEDIKIQKDGKDIEFYNKNTTIVFEAKENGAYSIQIEDEVEMINISGIDMEEPILNDVVYENGILTLNADDELSGLSFEDSYVEYNGTKYQLDGTMKVTGDFDGTVYVHLCDFLGNSATYEMNISKERVE